MIPARTLPWKHSLEGLPLLAPTAPEWFEIASPNLPELLNDHAHCELKAASTALRFIGRYADDPEMVQDMMALSYEEMGHFRRVRGLLTEIGGTLTPPRQDRYVRRIRDWSFRQPGGVGAKADAFLAAAIVEARSCERFRVLAEGFAPANTRELADFYSSLADAEARHWETFARLARRSASPDQVDARLGDFARAEGDILAALPVEPRMH